MNEFDVYNFAQNLLPLMIPIVMVFIFYNFLSKFNIFGSNDDYYPLHTYDLENLTIIQEKTCSYCGQNGKKINKEFLYFPKTFGEIEKKCVWCGAVND